MTDIDKVIEKIKKAVRLANRTTESGERDTALRLAKSLAERNGIAFDEIEADAGADADRAVREDEEGWAKDATGSEFGCSCFVLREHFGVILMLRRFKGVGRRRFTWFGSPLNIDIAKHVHHILMRESRRAWREFSAAEKERGEEQPKRESFIKGFFWAISCRLAEHPLRNDAQLKEDRRRADAKLLAFAQENEVRTRQVRNRKMEAGSFVGGADAAKGVNLARPCEGRETERPDALSAADGRPALALAEGGAA